MLLRFIRLLQPLQPSPSAGDVVRGYLTSAGSIAATASCMANVGLKQIQSLVSAAKNPVNPAMKMKYLALALLTSSVLVAAAVQTALLRKDIPAAPSYYVRAYQDGMYIIEYDGRQMAAACRETLTWLNGI